DSISAAIHAANTSANAQARVVIQPRTPTPEQISAARAPTPHAPKGPVPSRPRIQDYRIESSPEIEISLADESGHLRAPRDTAVDTPDATIPNQTARPAARTSTGERPASHVGATLPPAPRPASRPSF